MKLRTFFRKSFLDESNPSRVRTSVAAIAISEIYRLIFLLAFLLVLVHVDLISLTGALIICVAIYVFDVTTFSIYVRELVSAINFLGGLYATPHNPPPPPKVRQVLHQNLIDAGIKLHEHWHAREQRARDFLFSRERVFDAIPDALFLLRADGVVLGANSAAHSFFRRDLIGMNVASFLRDPDILDAIEAGDPSHRVVWSPPEESHRTFDISISRLAADERTSSSNVLICFHDISEVKHLEKMRADFVANASHELRTPLTSLIGYTETLQTSARDDETARNLFLGIMLEQAQRMQRIITDLLSLSRIEMQAHSPPKDRISLADSLDVVLRTVEMIARKRGVDILSDIPENLPDALGDRDQVIHVFQNLIDNALKYGKHRSPVLVRARLRERGPLSMPVSTRTPCLFVEIRNASEPIAPQHLARLTERFYRIDRARSRDLGGTGLGLAIVKHVMTRHRGALGFESQPDGAFSVHLYLPIFRDLA